MISDWKAYVAILEVRRHRLEGQDFSHEVRRKLAVQKLDVRQKRAVFKLHAGWLINRTPGEFRNWGLLIKLKRLLCRNPTQRGESLKLNFWP